jgi:hypothetical protein
MRILVRGKGLGLIPEPLLGYRMSLSQGSSAYERTRTTRSEFFEVMDQVLQQFSPDAETLSLYQTLERLDRFQGELNRVAGGDLDGDGFGQSLSWFLDPVHPERLRSLGAVDRLRIRGSRMVLALQGTRWAAPAARRLINWTDLRTSPILRWAVNLRRSQRAAAGKAQ